MKYTPTFAIYDNSTNDGGKGSGNFGHKGIPGQVGGSTATGGGESTNKNFAWKNTKDHFNKSSHILTKEEIQAVKDTAKEMGIPEDRLVFNSLSVDVTSFNSNLGVMVKGDIIPTEKGEQLGASIKVVLAHEWYGHNNPDVVKFDLQGLREHGNTKSHIADIEIMACEKALAWAEKNLSPNEVKYIRQDLANRVEEYNTNIEKWQKEEGAKV